MTWVKIDDRAATHPKLRDVGPEAAWLWVAGLCWCNGHHTDGVIRKRDVGAIYPGGYTASALKRSINWLLSAKLWVDEGDVYRVNDYQDYQEEALKESRNSRLKRDRERKRVSRASEKSSASRQSVRMSAPDVRGQSEDSPRTCPADVSEAVPAESEHPAPSRPVPPRPAPSDGPPALALDGAEDPASLGLVQSGYSRRYESKRNVAYQSGGLHRQSFVAVARFADAEAERSGDDVREIVSRTLDGFFADAWIAERSFPPGALAKDPGKYYRPPPKADPAAAPAREPDEVDRLRAKAHDLRTLHGDFVGAAECEAKVRTLLVEERRNRARGAGAGPSR